MTKLEEIASEMKAVFSAGRFRLLDSILPVFVYLGLYALVGLDVAWKGALAIAAILFVWRTVRKESLVYVLAGSAGVVLAVILVLRSGEGADFFLPGLISGGVTVVACVLSVVVNYPLVALTSAVVRRWPLGWFRHSRVLPAYNEVTIGWALAFSLRLAIELGLYLNGEVGALGTLRLFLGWPFILLLLIGTYLYGTSRLRQLGGPGVEEFRAGKPPPWEGQQRGF